MLWSFDKSLSGITWSVVVLAAMAGACVAEDKADKKSSNKEAKEDAKEQADIYQFPETEDPAVLAKFIETIITYKPKSREDNKRHSEKAPPLVKQAADRILSLDEEGKSEPAKFAKRVLLQMRIMQMGDVSAEEQEKLLDDLLAYLSAQEKLERMDLGLAVRVAELLENYQHPAAVRANQGIGDLLVKHEDPNVANLGKVMQGVARRLNLVGNEMELTGTTFDGSEFNVADWKGKVVLVDFWATWCGPCIAEFPKVREHYKKFHDKGFEVVGVSLDQNRAELEKFVKENDVPWTIVHQNDGSPTHPAAEHYGITAIPFMALIDREGKVVSITARGEELDRLLEKQFAESE